jgi:endo-1,4-beta-mannosidase
MKITIEIAGSQGSKHNKKLALVCNYEQLICLYCAIIEHKKLEPIEIDKAATRERQPLKSW